MDLAKSMPLGIVLTERAHPNFKSCEFAKYALATLCQIRWPAFHNVLTGRPPVARLPRKLPVLQGGACPRRLGPLRGSARYPPQYSLANPIPIVALGASASLEDTG